MFAFKQVITIEDPQHTVLTGLPFQPGERVEVVMLAEEAPPVPNRKATFHTFKVDRIVIPGRDKRYER